MAFDWMSPQFKDSVSTQSYDPPAEIEGVQLVELRTFSDEGGDFCELTRFTEAGALAHFPDYRPAQISYSSLEPGMVKAWHLHARQDDLWFVPPCDRLLVGLLDTRENSQSHGVSKRLTLGVGTARLLLVPRGVAHGVANLSSRPASIIYFSNTAFDPASPDEHRLPHDIVGADFWMLRPG